ncbi:MAG: S-layer homology domain-containing protein, partial [Desulfocucumaceae bacterium]
VYNVTVNRAAPSGNADLSTLTVSQGTLDPVFVAGTTAYTVNVANSVTSIDVTATLADAGAAMTVNDQAQASGQAKAVSLNVGGNPVTIVVVAQDGTSKAYTVTVLRADQNLGLTFSYTDGDADHLYFNGNSLGLAVSGLSVPDGNIRVALGVLTGQSQFDTSHPVLSGMSSAGSYYFLTSAVTGGSFSVSGTIDNSGNTTLPIGMIGMQIYTSQDGSNWQQLGSPVPVDPAGNNNEALVGLVIPDGSVTVSPALSDINNLYNTECPVRFTAYQDVGGQQVEFGSIEFPAGIDIITSRGQLAQLQGGINLLGALDLATGEAQYFIGVNTQSLTFLAERGATARINNLPEGFAGIQIVNEDDATAEVSGISVSGNTLTFNVNHFSSYKVNGAVPPSWPQGSTLSSSSVGENSLTLAWTAATDNVAVTQYKIYKNGTALTTVSNVLTVSITGLDPGTQYTFRVEAGDAANSWSTGGPSTTVTTASSGGGGNGSGVSSDLTGLALSGNPANYAFSGSTYTYSGVTVANNVAGITVTPTGTGTITVDGVEVTSGQASATVTLEPGVARTITVVVTETGKTPRSYTIQVTRASGPIIAATATDLSITMESGNTAVSVNNNKWTLKITNGTVKAEVTEDDLIITGLPSGLTATAAKGTGNTINIIAGGTANPALNASVAVSIAVRGSGVAEAGASNSAAINVTVNTAPITTPAVTVTNNRKDLTVDSSTPATTVTVPQNVTDSTINVAPLVSDIAEGRTATLPSNMTIEAATSLGQVQVVMPATTTITAPAGWTGTINVPTVKPNNSVAVTPDPGKDATVNAVIEVGFGDVPLTFSKAVRILIPGQAGKDAGYYRGGTFNKITRICAEDSQAWADNDANIPAGGDGRIDVGSDLIIWTKHFTRFIAYTQTASNGGGGGGYITPAEGKTVTTSGGTVTESGATITIPAGAVSGDIKVKVERVINASGLPVAAGSKLVSQVLEITKDKSINFEKPVTITLSFDKSKVDTTKYNLSIFWYDEDSRKWVELKNVKVDIETGKVSGEADHFTKFAVLAVEKPAEPQVQAPGVTIKDIAGHWSEAAVKALVESGAISGYPEGTFRPDSRITRAEFAAVMVKAFKLQPKGGKVFEDTAGHWARDAIATAGAHGIVNGYGDTSFGPDDPITREQMAVMIVIAAKPAPVTDQASFADGADISGWAREAVATATKKGIMKGYPDNTVKPKGSATRAEAVAVVFNALK